jgi:hypothetical protein
MHNRNILLVTAILASALPVRAQNQDRAAPIDAIVSSIGAGNLAWVDVLRLPPDAQFRVNVTPERLENWCENKVTLRNSELNREELTIVLKSVKLRSTSTKLDSLDVRWGIVFYSMLPEDKRIASLYFDKHGRQGALNTLATSFGPDFFPRLMKALHVSID